MISAVVLTFNSEASIERTLASLRQVAEAVYVVNSFSTDRTMQICLENGCQVIQRSFSTYADQRNWAIEKFHDTARWQLHVDADEVLDADLVDNIKHLDLANSEYDGYIFVRRIVFMGKILKYGGISKTWHMRLFRPGKGKVEERVYDQHFICVGPLKILNGSMLDYQEVSLSEWTARHNKWSDFEAREICSAKSEASGTIKGKMRGNIIEKKRYKKEIYYKLPLFVRSLAYFIYRYILKFGIFDGVEGLIYHVLQGFWFRFLVDAKIYETKRSRSLNEDRTDAGN